MRRLFPTFVRGWPAVGLLLLRLVVAMALLDRAGSTLWDSPPLHLAVVSAVLVISALLLIVGLWTPIAASLVTVTELWKIFAFPSDRWIYILLGALAAALVMLGPGAFSFDTRLYGWKRIELPTRKG